MMSTPSLPTIVELSGQYAPVGKDVEEGLAGKLGEIEYVAIGAAVDQIIGRRIERRRDGKAHAIGARARIDRIHAAGTIDDVAARRSDQQVFSSGAGNRRHGLLPLFPGSAH